MVYTKKFDQLKRKAITLRKGGKSIREIENVLSVSRSTLSGWFKNVNLSEHQRLFLKEKWFLGLVKARESAVLYHNKKKSERLQIAKTNAELSVNALDLNDKNILKLALSMLFSGEGFKAAEETSLGNSDPKIVRAFLKLIDNIYHLNRDKLRLYLHLRADQNVNREIRYWSHILELEAKYFKIAPVDKRTIGKKTYPEYHGVCVVRYYDVSIKREILALTDNFYERLMN